MPFLKVKTNDEWVPIGWTEQVVDDTLSSTSTNPVQNKVVNEAIATLTELTANLDEKADSSHKHTIADISDLDKGSPNGVAELDSTGKVPTSQLPSFVDDVIEGYLSNGKFYNDSAYTTEIVGESGKIYLDISSNKTYRWSGTTFVLISETISLGETSSTAYRGDRGKIAYDHSQLTKGNPHEVTKSDIGLESVENKSSSTIRSELTKENITTALGYTPSTRATVLYYNPQGNNTSEAISLSDNTNNYDRIEIIYGRGWGCASVVVPIKNVTGKEAVMQLTVSNGLTFTFYTGACTFNGSILQRGSIASTTDKETCLVFDPTTSGSIKYTHTTFSSPPGFPLYIYKVIGYKD